MLPEIAPRRIPTAFRTPLTADQTTDNQRRELEAIASRHNWPVVCVFEDSGCPTPDQHYQSAMTDQQFQLLLRYLQVIVAILGLMAGVLLALALTYL
jgi:hypothetical protein